MSQRKWLILTALAMEARAISAECAAQMANRGAELHIIGIRACRMPPNLLNGIDGGIILAGLAGGLDPALMVGEIVMEAPSEGPWSGLPCRHGKIHTSDHLIATVEEKQRIFRETGCLAVDMESGIVRKLAEASGVPVLAIRAISDAAGDSLPPRMMNWIDEVGQPKATKLAAELASHPQQIPAMIRLGKNSRIAVQQMVHAVALVLQRI